MRFVLTGTYNSCNKGDAAMELSAVEALARHFPGSHVIILSPFPNLDRPFYEPIEVANCNRRRLIFATLDLGRALLWRMMAKVVSHNHLNWLLSRQSRVVRDADLLVDLSGDMLTEDYGPFVAYSHFLPIMRAMALGTPVYLCAQSIGPFVLTKWLAKWILRRSTQITVRDSISLRYLRNEMGSLDSACQTADLAFLLEPSSSERVDEVLNAEGIRATDGPLVGISVSGLIEQHYHRKNCNAGTTPFVTLMAEIISSVVEQFGAHAVLIPHVTGPTPIKDDRRIAERISQEVGIDVRDRVWALKGEYRPEELKGVIGRCTAFIGARMHANIAALSQSIPTVAIAYSHKTPGIMQSLGVEGFVIQIEDLTRPGAVALIRRAITERREISRVLDSRVCELRGAADENIACIRDILKRSEAA